MIPAEPVPAPTSEPEVHPRRWLPDLLGVAWVIVAAGAVMAPALWHGWSLGPFDQLSQLGLTQHSQPIPHNSQVFDLIREIIPWTTLSWTQVHQGILPLWNPYSALGAPLAFNWQSATFSLPALVGYLVPVRLDYTDPGAHHAAHRRHRHVRAGPGRAARRARGGHGRHRVRAQRRIHLGAGMADRRRHVLVRLVVRLHHPGGAGKAPPS